jgi:phosphoribosylanthranilate isomerase
MALIVKICGLSTEETVDAALAAGADMVGFVLFPPSPRNVSLKRAAALAKRARGKAETVALIVDLHPGGIAQIAEEMKPDWLQLHGRETPARVTETRALFSGRIMKAIGVRLAGDVALAEHYLPVVDRILFDAKAPEDSDRPGGHGRMFDWRLLRAKQIEAPFMLSGGIDTRNLADAITIARPAGVDVSSSVETEPGKKDVGLIRDFIRAVRRIDAGHSQLDERAPSRERSAS